MLGPGVTWYLVVAAALFAIGTMGVMLRRSPLIVLLSLEIMLNAGNLALVGFSRLHGELDGQVFALAVMAVAASEVVRRPGTDRGHGTAPPAARRRHDDGASRLMALAAGGWTSACSRRSPARWPSPWPAGASRAARPGGSPPCRCSSPSPARSPRS